MFIKGALQLRDNNPVIPTRPDEIINPISQGRPDEIERNFMGQVVRNLFTLWNKIFDFNAKHYLIGSDYSAIIERILRFTQNDSDAFKTSATDLVRWTEKQVRKAVKNRTLFELQRMALEWVCTIWAFRT